MIVGQAPEGLGLNLATNHPYESGVTAKTVGAFGLFLSRVLPKWARISGQQTRFWLKRIGVMKTTFLTKAVSKAQTSATQVDWVVLAAIALGVGVVFVTSIGGFLNGLSLSIVEQAGARISGFTTQHP
jgi:hypothetical protein